MGEVMHQGRYGWLKDYQNLYDELTLWKWRYRKALAEAVRMADGDLATVSFTAKSRSSKVDDEIERCRKNVHALQAEQKSLMELVDSFHGIDNDILRLKYIDGLSLEEIAEKLDYSEDTIKKRHAELHRRLDFLDSIGEVELELGNRYDWQTSQDEKADRDPNFYG